MSVFVFNIIPIEFGHIGERETGVALEDEQISCLLKMRGIEVEGTDAIDFFFEQVFDAFGSSPFYFHHFIWVVFDDAHAYGFIDVSFETFVVAVDGGLLVLVGV